MGCDYYTQLVLRIIYKDAEGKAAQYDEVEERIPHYCFTDESYDPDFQNPNEQNELQERIDEYGEKILYKDGTWNCTEYGKKHVLLICEEKSIPETSLVKAFKFMRGWWR